MKTSQLTHDGAGRVLSVGPFLVWGFLGTGDVRDVAESTHLSYDSCSKSRAWLIGGFSVTLVCISNLTSGISHASRTRKDLPPKLQNQSELSLVEVQQHPIPLVVAGAEFS